jgi:hypothetical protein
MDRNEEIAKIFQNAKSPEEAIENLGKAGIELSEEELSETAGGGGWCSPEAKTICPKCHKWGAEWLIAKRVNFTCPKCGTKLVFMRSGKPIPPDVNQFP